MGSFDTIKELAKQGVANLMAHVPAMEEYFCQHVSGRLCDPNTGEFVGPMYTYMQEQDVDDATRLALESAICITGGGVCGNVDTPFVVESGDNRSQEVAINGSLYNISSEELLPEG